MIQAGLPGVRGARAGFTLIELIVGVAIIGILISIAMPMLHAAQLRARYSRAGANARVVVTQAIAFAVTRGVYPRGIAELRNSGFVSLPDTDPWNMNYQLSAMLLNGAAPDTNAEVWVCSMGPIHVGNCPDPTSSAISVGRFPNTGLNGSVGFSSVYGSWTGF